MIPMSCAASICRPPVSAPQAEAGEAPGSEAAARRLCRRPHDQLKSVQSQPCFCSSRPMLRAAASNSPSLGDESSMTIGLKPVAQFGRKGPAHDHAPVLGARCCCGTVSRRCRSHTGMPLTVPTGRPAAAALFGEAAHLHDPCAVAIPKASSRVTTCSISSAKSDGQAAAMIDGGRREPRKLDDQRGGAIYRRSALQPIIVPDASFAQGAGASLCAHRSRRLPRFGVFALRFRLELAPPIGPGLP